MMVANMHASYDVFQGLFVSPVKQSFESKRNFGRQSFAKTDKSMLKSVRIQLSRFVWRGGTGTTAKSLTSWLPPRDRDDWWFVKDSTMM